MYLFLTNTQLFTSQDVNWWIWSGVDYLWNIVMFLSAVWTLILTAPIHCRGSIGEQICTNEKKNHLHLGWPEGELVSMKMGESRDTRRSRHHRTTIVFTLLLLRCHVISLLFIPKKKKKKSCLCEKKIKKIYISCFFGQSLCLIQTECSVAVLQSSRGFLIDCIQNLCSRNLLKRTRWNTIYNESRAVTRELTHHIIHKLLS